MKLFSKLTVVLTIGTDSETVGCDARVTATGI
jgi:hypothetical protein